MTVRSTFSRPLQWIPTLRLSRHHHHHLFLLLLLEQYYFALFCAYVVLFLLYGAMAVRHRRNSTWLHTSTLGVIAVGAIECLAMFALYAVMNSTGQPACCPAPLLALAAVALNTLKRTISRVLLLVICLGVGVVRPTLDKCRTGVVATVGSLFFVLVLWKDCSLLESNGAPKTSISALSLPVLFLDASFLTWIFYALAQVRVRVGLCCGIVLRMRLAFVAYEERQRDPRGYVLNLPSPPFPLSAARSRRSCKTRPTGPRRNSRS